MWCSPLAAMNPSADATAVNWPMALPRSNEYGMMARK